LIALISNAHLIAAL